MKFKNVSTVSTIDGLISIFCDHECRGTNLYHEYFFLNKEHKIVARFESTGVLSVEQLSEEIENIFYLSETTWDSDKKRHERDVIVRVNPDLTYDVLHHIEDYESGIEDGAFAIKKNGLWGFMDAYGNEFIKPQYEDYVSFSCGLAGIYKNGKWGFINKKNELVIPCEYDFSDDRKCLFTEYENKLYVSVRKNGKWGIIDSNNNVIITFKYDDISSANKIIWTKLGEKCGFIDINDNIVVPFEDDDCEEDFHNFCELSEYHLISQKGLVGLIDNNGNIVIPIQYKGIEVSEDKIIVAHKENNKCILINFKNEQLSDEYDNIDVFPDDGMLEVYNRVDDKRMYGYITETGELAIPLKYARTKHFEGGLTVAETRDFKAEVINKQGEVLYRAKKYRDVFNMGKGYILAENKDGEFEIKKLI